MTLILFTTLAQISPADFVMQVKLISTLLLKSSSFLVEIGWESDRGFGWSGFCSESSRSRSLNSSLLSQGKKIFEHLYNDQLETLLGKEGVMKDFQN